jgi:hypothetical protein
VKEGKTHSSGSHLLKKDHHVSIALSECQTSEPQT